MDRTSICTIFPMYMFIYFFATVVISSKILKFQENYGNEDGMCQKLICVMQRLLLCNVLSK